MFKKRGRPKGVELTKVGLPFSKKIKRSNPKNLIVLFIRLKSAKKEKTLLECGVSTFAANNALKGVLVINKKLKFDLTRHIRHHKRRKI